MDVADGSLEKAQISFENFKNQGFFRNQHRSHTLLHANV